jgi:hypothetical protein
MKMILLLYLEDDAHCVQSLLEEHDVVAYSELPLEGHGEGRPAGWYGDIPPFHSRMAFTVVPEARAEELLDAVRACRGCQDTRHPIHALQLGVEKVARSAPSGSDLS